MDTDKSGDDGLVDLTKDVTEKQSMRGQEKKVSVQLIVQERQIVVEVVEKGCNQNHKYDVCLSAMHVFYGAPIGKDGLTRLVDTYNVWLSQEYVEMTSIQ